MCVCWRRSKFFNCVRLQRFLLDYTVDVQKLRGDYFVHLGTMICRKLVSNFVP